MFGFVTASFQELSKEERRRYGAVYCGICRAIGQRSGQIARMNLSYDMAFLALLLMSLYEPEETSGSARCALHPIRKRPWVDNTYVRYAADMNVLLAFYKCQDDYMDDRSRRALIMAHKLRPHVEAIHCRWPRQARAIQLGLEELTRLEQRNCADIDEVANCFGHLLGSVFEYEQDHWSPFLQEMGMALGRFIYLADAVADLPTDERKKKYNPYLAAGLLDRQQQEQHLLLAMGRCTHYFEKLPLVQDKRLLDNILYSGVWTQFPKKRKEATP